MAEYTAITDALGDYSERYNVLAATLGTSAAAINQPVADAEWKAACDQADSFCQNAFTDITVARLPFSVLLPAKVQVGVVGLAAYWYMKRVFGIVSETVGSVSETFSDATFDADMMRCFGSKRIEPGF